MAVIISLNYGNKLSYGNDITQIYNLSNTPPGLSYNELMKKYWNWWVNVPENQTHQCQFHDIGQVVFLADPLKTSKTLTCGEYKIPEGKALFFPLISSEYDQNVDSGYQTDQQLLDSAKKENEGGSKTVFIDGIKIPESDLDKLRTNSSAWNLTILPENQYKTEPGTFRAITEGIYVLVKPLPAGNHVITYNASSTKPTNTVDADVNYKLTINPTSK